MRCAVAWCGIIKVPAFRRGFFMAQGGMRSGWRVAILFVLFVVLFAVLAGAYPLCASDRAALAVIPERLRPASFRSMSCSCWCRPLAQASSWRCWKGRFGRPVAWLGRENSAPAGPAEAGGSRRSAWRADAAAHRPWRYQPGAAGFGGDIRYGAGWLLASLLTGLAEEFLPARLPAAAFGRGIGFWPAAFSPACCSASCMGIMPGRR